jgi:hypothetical protein
MRQQQVVVGCTTYWAGAPDTDQHVVGLVGLLLYARADLHTKWLAVATLDACTWNGVLSSRFNHGAATVERSPACLDTRTCRR